MLVARVNASTVAVNCDSLRTVPNDRRTMVKIKHNLRGRQLLKVKE
jgi:hypothetical protein